jgi:hypothetical protein
MAFKHLGTANLSREIQTHCDGTQHVKLTLPLNRYSGEPFGIQVFPCTCPKPPVEEPKT